MASQHAPLFAHSYAAGAPNRCLASGALLTLPLLHSSECQRTCARHP